MAATVPPDAELTTREVARWLGLAVRSIQLMVDRGELQAWKTPGGHRRISRASVQAWLATRPGGTAAPAAPRPAARANGTDVLLIEDSIHHQNMVRLLVERAFPDVNLAVAGDGIAGLALAGQLQPAVLLVDILLPGIDGAALITSLRSQPQFSASRLVVVTSLDAAQRRPYEFALTDVPVIHKSRLGQDLVPCLARLLGRRARKVALPPV